tara:strand:+ start:69 stop:290 length:222 start_codon:yes stop_codon:yes gene_type:complete
MLIAITIIVVGASITMSLQVIIDLILLHTSKKGIDDDYRWNHAKRGVLLYFPAAILFNASMTSLVYGVWALFN